MPVAVSARYKRKFATALPETVSTCRYIDNVIINNFDFNFIYVLNNVSNRESVSELDVVRHICILYSPGPVPAGQLIEWEFSPTHSKTV